MCFRIKFCIGGVVRKVLWLELRRRGSDEVKGRVRGRWRRMFLVLVRRVRFFEGGGKFWEILSEGVT